MSDLPFDINGDPLPVSKSSKGNKKDTTGVRIIRTPSPSNLATTIATNKRHPSSSASSHSPDKSLRLVTGPSGTVVGDLQSDTIRTLSSGPNGSPHKHTTASRAASPAGSTSSKKSYRIIKDTIPSPAQESQFDVGGNITTEARSRSRSTSSAHKSTGLVADPTGSVVEDLKADTLAFIERRRSRKQHFDVNGDVIHSAESSHVRTKHYISGTARSRSPPRARKGSAGPLPPSGLSTPVAASQAVFGGSSEHADTHRRGSASSASSISSGYIKAAGETKPTRRTRHGAR